MKKYRGIPAGYEDDSDKGDDDDEVDFMGRITQNLKIKVVPDITHGAGFNGEDFDSRLSVDMDNWFELCKEQWNACMNKRTPAAQQNLRMVFLKDGQPLLLALKLFANCPGCNNLRNKSLALFILETICDLHKQHPEISANCDDNTRMIAFNFIKKCGIVTLIKAMIVTYEMTKIRELLVPKIRELITEGYYKEAANWIIYLEITHLFDIFDVVFPLLLQDKIFLVEEYLNIAKDQQMPIVKFLDSLLDKHKTVYELCDELLTKYKYTDIKHNILSYRPMSKLVMRLAKKYKIAAHFTPNLNFTKACSYMHYLYHKYNDGGMSCDSWRELIRDTATTKPLKMDLVTTIASYGDLDESVYWVKYFQIPTAECPSSIRERLLQHDCANDDRLNSVIDSESDTNLNNTSSSTKAATTAMATSASATSAATLNVGTSKSKKNVSFDAQNYLTFALPVERISLIDNKCQFIEMLSYLSTQSLIAFDSEWKPSVCNDDIVSLLQLSTIERVYLLDCLSPHLCADLWQQLGSMIFNNLEILKIGFSLQQDLRMLYKSLPQLQLNLQASSCYLDLRELWRRLKHLQIVNFPYGDGLHAGESLCALTELCLGKQLDKSNQCSNWANRPLRHDQIIYAALDAHCLLQVYQVLAELLLRKGLDIDLVVDEITTAKTGYLFRMKRVVAEHKGNADVGATAVTTMTTTTNNATASEADFVSVTDIKFLCDHMLNGFSKELRKLGIDCIDITTSSPSTSLSPAAKPKDLNYYIDLAKNEKRLVLTRSTRYDYFVSELTHKQCLEISTDLLIDELLNIINCLNIAVYERNLFTRCLSCNGNQFIVAFKNEMHIMRFGQFRCEWGEPVLDRNNTMKQLNEKTLQLLNVDETILSTKRTYHNKPIKLNRIKPHILRTKDHFLICDNCGICTWDGAHPLHSRITNIIAINPAGVRTTKTTTKSTTSKLTK